MGWEKRVAQSSGRPYEFAAKGSEEYNDAMMILDGEFKKAHTDGYKYWIQRGGVGRRAIEEKIKKTEKTFKEVKKQTGAPPWHIHPWTWTEMEGEIPCGNCWNLMRTCKDFGYDGLLVRFFCGHAPYEMTYMKIVRKRKGVMLEKVYKKECSRQSDGDGLLQASRRWEANRLAKLRESRPPETKKKVAEMKEKGKKMWGGKDIDKVIKEGKIPGQDTT